MREEGGTPGSISCQEPLGFISSNEATKQDKTPSQVVCLARKSMGKLGEQQQLWGSLAAPRRALMDEDPEHGEATRSSKG